MMVLSPSAIAEGGGKGWLIPELPLRSFRILLLIRRWSARFTRPCQKERLKKNRRPQLRPLAGSSGACSGNRTLAAQLQLRGSDCAEDTQPIDDVDLDADNYPPLGRHRLAARLEHGSVASREPWPCTP